MLITFKDTVHKEDWLHRELLNSLTHEAIKSGEETQSYEVKLLVNGIELEPKLLELLLNGIEKHIDREAVKLAEDKLQDALRKARKLEEMVDEACEKIRDEFKLENPVD